MLETSIEYRDGHRLTVVQTRLVGRFVELNPRTPRCREDIVTHPAVGYLEDGRDGRELVIHPFAAAFASRFVDMILPPDEILFRQPVERLVRDELNESLKGSRVTANVRFTSPLVSLDGLEMRKAVKQLLDAGSVIEPLLRLHSPLFR